MPLQSIAQQRIYQRIAAQIGDMIRDGEFAPGQRLPPERDLARTFGVSRNVVREAMVALEIAGLVDVRVGAGTFVAARLHAVEMVALRRARLLIETEIAALAAEFRTEADVAAIREAAERAAAAAESGREAAHWGRRFHLSLAEATRNGTLVAVVRHLWDAPGEAGTGLSGAACRRIAEAVAERNVEGARAAMRTHLGAADPGVPAPLDLAPAGGPPASPRRRRS